MSCRCDFSDLLVTECGCLHCRPDLSPKPESLDRHVTHTSRARFSGKCPACGERIREGDTIGPNEDGTWICSGCFA